MIPIFKSLEQISTGYTVFEQDQVLTHEQLNSLADYADDQIRLTRVKLLGTGIACGLRLIESDGVYITRGIGVTTDGDILYLDQDTLYTQFRVYDETYPAYPPLYTHNDPMESILPTWELLTEDATGDDIYPLSALGLDLYNLTVVLYMESYLKDDDICSGTDCDNLGKAALNRMKVLLVNDEAAEQLSAYSESMPSVQEGFHALMHLEANRAVVNTSLNSGTAIANSFRAACNSMHTNLTTVLSSLFSIVRQYLGPVLGDDPTSVWLSRLNAARAAYLASEVATQYYYDFFKDLVETCNALRHLLFGDTVQCAQGFEHFPKHLMLGRINLITTAPETYRTRFYPSPFTGGRQGNREHAKFLVQKLDAMLRNFAATYTPVGGGVAEIRITPSFLEDVSLEERAIPIYYPATSSNQFNNRWSFRLAQREMARYNYSYHAAAYSALGGAANPFASQIGRNSFFRIEGHLGKPVSTVLSTIKSLITNGNVPIAVQAIFAGTNRQQISVKPAIRYTPLHSLHYVLRQDLVHQMDDVTRFSTTFKDKVFAESYTLTTTPDDCDCPSIRNLATTSSSTVINNANLVKATLAKDYTAYRLDTSWRPAIQSTLETASRFKADLGAVVKTDFATPYDTLITTPHSTWLPWIDDIITKNDQKEDDKLMLPNFIQRHSGVEHFAGVIRGGTFLIVYDSTNTVIADFMVPYYLPERETDVVDEPVLVKPAIKTNYVLDQGIKVQPSRGTLINDRVNSAVNIAKADLVSVVDGKLFQHNSNINTQLTAHSNNVASQLTFQHSYMDLFQDSINILGGAVPRKDQLRSAGPPPEPPISDESLAAQVAEHNAKAVEARRLLQLALASTTESERQMYYQQYFMAEQALISVTMQIMQYLDDTTMSVESDTDGGRAIKKITPDISAIYDSEPAFMLKSALLRLNRLKGGDITFQQLVGAMIMILNERLDEAK